MRGRDPFADPKPLIHRVYAYVAYRVGEGADAEDITSATFERALKYRDRFDAGRGEAAAWLIGIARRQIADHYGAQPLLVAEVPESAVESDFESEAAARLDLRRAVGAIGDRDRELIALRFGADLTARQIGELLGMNTNAVEVALHRTLRTLRSVLDRPASPDAPREGMAVE